MKTYEKYIINNDLNEANLIKSIATFKKAVKLIGDLIILSKVDLDEYEMQDKINGILDDLDNILRNRNVQPVYRDMIRCGVKTALKNLNYKNRVNIGY